MMDLVDQTKASLDDPNSPLWLPGLTTTLVEWGWQRLYRRTGIRASEYGTARVLAGNAEAPRHVVTHLSICPGAEGVASTTLTEGLTREFARRYQDKGLKFYAPDEIAHTTVLGCILEAIEILAQAPTLQNTIAGLVRALHVLEPEDDDCDVSFSDPEVPFSIFVSVPQRRIPPDALRVAESMVHEAMHLQLTLIEQVVPLVMPTSNTYYSPWKGENRTPRGILHALYVFRVIDRFLGLLLGIPDFLNDCTDYMLGRRREIAEQIREVQSFQGDGCLTAHGARFVGRLLSA